MHFNLDLSGLTAALTGMFMMAAGSIWSLTALIAGLVKWSKMRVPIVKQKVFAHMVAALFIIVMGGLFTLLASINGAQWKPMRKALDNLSIFYAIAILGLSFLLIYMINKKRFKQ